jgi:hypothetical protein
MLRERQQPSWMQAQRRNSCEDRRMSDRLASY